jgi:hypothetical protein
MLVSMVDERAVRFQQMMQQVMPTADALERSIGSSSPTRSPLNSMGEAYLRNSQEQMRQQANVGRGVLDFLNPAPSLTSAVAEGRAPRPADVALDAGLFAAGFIPFAGPGIRAGGQAARAARPALETAETINARRDAINRLLNRQGPEALEEYLQRPLTAYQATQNPDLLRRFFSETSERIPVGTQMYRAPSAGQVRPQQYSQSVPLPREAGAEWLPNRIQSTAGSEDLQRLGGLVKGLTPDTGGGQTYAPGMVAIEAMEDLPGIYNLNSYFDALDSRGLYRIPTRSNFTTESVLGPQTRYVVRDYIPDAGEGFPTWYLNAYSR